jgi:pilus assembly protein CpaC
MGHHERKEEGLMSPSILRDVMRGAAVALCLVMTLGASARAEDQGEVVRIAVGHSTVLQSSEEVRTVAVAEPDIADAAVGSARTVVVTARTAGSTNVVVYNEGGRFKVYDVEVYVPNGDKQVLLHCTVSELSGNAVRELGMDIFAAGNTNNRQIDGSLGGGVYNSKLTDDASPFDGTMKVQSATDIVVSYVRNDGRLGLQAAIKALEEKGDVRTLANPSLLTTSGKPASFLSGGEFAYQIISGSGTGAAPAIQFKEFGVRLNFTPTVLENGSILLKVASEVSEPDWSRSVFGVPPLNSRKAETVVTLKSGEYLAIGGLRDQRSNKLKHHIPVIGYIPVLGWLFSYSRVETSTKDLLIFLSPEIVQPETSKPAVPTDRPESTGKPAAPTDHPERR